MSWLNVIGRVAWAWQMLLGKSREAKTMNEFIFRMVFSNRTSNRFGHRRRHRPIGNDRIQRIPQLVCRRSKTLFPKIEIRVVDPPVVKNFSIAAHDDRL